MTLTRPLKEYYLSDDGRIYLRPLTDADVTDRYLSWFSDSDVTRFLEARNLTHDDVIQHMRHGRDSGTFEMLAICDAATKLHIGNVKIGPIDHKHGLADLPIVLGDRAFWGQGLAPVAIRVGNQIAFEEFGMRKLTGGMYESNVASLRSYLKAGWVEEARLRFHYEVPKGREDRIIISCFNPAFFELVDGSYVLRPTS